MPAKIKVIREISEFDKIADNWNELLSNTEARNLVTLRSEWISCTLKAYLKRYPLFVVTAWENGKLVGAIPLYKKRLKYKKILPLTTLQLVDCDMNPKKHILIESDDQNVLLELLEAISRYRREWCVLNLKGIRRDSQLMPRLIDKANKAKLSLQKKDLQETVYIDLNSTWEEYFNGLSKNRRKKIRRSLNLLGRQGKWEVRQIRTKREFEQFYPSMLRISRKSWKGNVSSDIASVEGDNLFYRDFSYIAAKSGWLRLWILEVEGNGIAFQWQIEYGDTTTSFRTDFDLDYERISPGVCLRIEILKKLFESNLRFYDMGSAQYGQKKIWGTQSLYHENLLIGRHRSLSKILVAIKNHSRFFSGRLGMGSKGPDIRTRI
jgi:CelD/BcsL family acetyltransferase involved in cellulose biosynthesis